MAKRPRTGANEEAETKYREGKPGALVRMTKPQWDLVDKKRGALSRPGYLAALALDAIGWNEEAKTAKRKPKK